MKKRKAKKAFIYQMYVVAAVLLLGVFTSIYQTSQQQNLQTRAFTNCDVSAADLVQSANEKSMFDQINAYRQQNGKPVLTWSTLLKRPAKWMSNDASKNNSGSYTDSLGRDTLARASDCGAPLGDSWGDAIGLGGASQALSAIESNSKDTLLDTNVTQMAVGQTGNYWDIIFADSSVGATNPTPTPVAATVAPTLSTTSAPTAAPTFASIGDCATNPACPTNTLAPQPTTDPGTQPTSDPALSPTPCPGTVSTNSFTANRWGKGGGGNNQGGLLQFLLQLLELLLQLLGGGSSAPVPTPSNPCASLSPTDIPVPTDVSVTP